MLKTSTLVQLLPLFLSIHGWSINSGETLPEVCPPVFPPCACEGPTDKEPYLHMTCTQAVSLNNVIQALGPAVDIRIGRLTIEDSNIGDLTQEAFSDYNIVKLELIKCNISKIHEFAFGGKTRTSIQELNLNSNFLTSIPSSALKRLNSLTILNLASNQIHQLTARTFYNWTSNTQLKRLDLGYNNLTDAAINSMTFHPLMRLNQLSLAGNQLGNVDQFVQKLVQQFYTMYHINLGGNGVHSIRKELPFRNLFSLSLENNEISYIHQKAFKRTRRLKYLYLHGNKFKRWPVETFEFCRNLRVLSMGENEIREIRTSSFYFLPNLKRLEMSNAKVSYIEQRSFEKLARLQSVILDHNRLTSISRTTFSNHFLLYTVDLGYNLINRIPSETFINTPSLRHVDLRSNRLTSLQKEAFDKSFRMDDGILRSVLLCGNPWNCANPHTTDLRSWLHLVDNIVIDTLHCTSTCANDGHALLVNGTRMNPDTTTTKGPVEWNTTPATVRTTETTTRTTTTTTATTTSTRATTTTTRATTTTSRTPFFPGGRVRSRNLGNRNSLVPRGRYVGRPRQRVVDFRGRNQLKMNTTATSIMNTTTTSAATTSTTPATIRTNKPFDLSTIMRPFVGNSNSRQPLPSLPYTLPPFPLKPVMIYTTRKWIQPATTTTKPTETLPQLYIFKPLSTMAPVLGGPHFELAPVNLVPHPLPAETGTTTAYTVTTTTKWPYPWNPNTKFSPHPATTTSQPTETTHTTPTTVSPSAATTTAESWISKQLRIKEINVIPIPADSRLAGQLMGFKHAMESFAKMAMTYFQKGGNQLPFNQRAV